MKFSWIILTVLLVCAYVYLDRQDTKVAAASGSPVTQGASGGTHRLAGSMQAKINYIEQNGSKAHPDQRPTVIT
ncbi:MAG TPA: hypothetical protein VJ848_04525, partial [Candidatus Angelobacter sp.]|nr:hypothetical protein [Candidatus Angelobacter sp.]